MKGIVHPFTGALHEQDGKATSASRSATSVGIFGIDGHWISGELRECDPQLCGWVGGPIIANHRVTSADHQRLRWDGPHDHSFQRMNSSAGGRLAGLKSVPMVYATGNRPAWL